MSAATARAELTTQMPKAARRPRQKSGKRQINRELLLILCVFAISAVLNVAFSSQRMVLGLYLFPTIFSAYHYGRRHAVLTASFSMFLVVLLSATNPAFLHSWSMASIPVFDIAAWTGLLIVTAYTVGTLHERNQSAVRDLRESYQGILLILQHITSDQKYSQNHPYRVSMFATQIAEEMNLDRDQVEDVRSCALLHEIEKVGISRDLLQQAAGMGPQDTAGEPSKGNSLRRVVAILNGFESAVKSEGKQERLSQLPMEARILHVADVYDTMTSAQESRISPSEAMERIVQRSGLEFDAEVIDALVRVFRRRAGGAEASR
jgi:HD-GYP domain-containing protein (c-di-GMP phosphodiesterase class II)